MAGVVGGLFAVAGCPEGSDDMMVGVDGTGWTATDTGGDLPGNECAGDVHDPNDSRADATSIGANTTLDAKLCTSSDEADWWTFSLSETSYVGVEVLFAKNGQDVALELWDASNGAMIDRSQGGADIQATHQLLGPGTYEVLVERRVGDPTYTLKTYALSTATPPAPEGGAIRVFCPRFDLDGGYVDATSQSGIYEDFGVEDEPDRWRPEAMLVQVLDEQANVLLGWGPLDQDGCTPPVWTPSPSDTEFALHYVLWSHFRRPALPDTFLITYDCEQMQPCSLPQVYYNWSTAQGAWVKETKFIASADDGQHLREELLVYWASAFAESRITMGTGAHLYARVLGSANQGGGRLLGCPDGYCPNGTSCETPDGTILDHCRPKTRATNNVGGHPTLDIASIAADAVKGSGAPEEKFTIAHELGHLQTVAVSGFNPTASDINYSWCSLANLGSGNHTLDSVEWQSAALIEGFADFYAVAVFNQLEEGAWYNVGPVAEDVENDTMRYQAQCQAALDIKTDNNECAQAGDATMCTDAGASNETDWAGTLWDFTKVVGETELVNVLRLLSDAGQLNWDPGSKTSTAYANILQAASLRFPGNGDEFDAAAQANGTNR